MVRGLEKFKEYFDAYPDNYVIIGGTACDIIIDEAGFAPRATKDIDIILVVEALSVEFVKQFWDFIHDGNYERKEKNDDERKYYRFIKPEDNDFPYQIELFSRNPDLLDLEDGTHLTPIPVEDNLISLSAILLDDDFYHYIIEHSVMEDGLHLANIEALIVLKAKAYLEIAERIANGGKGNGKHLRKHKGDIFRLAVMLTDEEIFELDGRIKTDMQAFVDAIANDLPDKQIFKAMGLGSILSETIFNLILKRFQLNGK